MSTKLCTRCGKEPRRDAKNATYCKDCHNAVRREARGSKVADEGVVPLCPTCKVNPRQETPIGSARKYYPYCKRCNSERRGKARPKPELTYKQRIGIIHKAFLRAVKRFEGM